MQKDLLDLARMLGVVAKAFENKLDRGGQPYFLHCLKVMEGVRHLGPRVMQIALAHDLVEDCEEWNIARLAVEGFSEEVVFGIDILTHKPEQSYEEYIKLIAHAKSYLKEIKRADLRHNSDISRLKGLRKKDFDRIEKYHKAYQYLSE